MLPFKELGGTGRLTLDIVTNRFFIGSMYTMIYLLDRGYCIVCR